MNHNHIENTNKRREGFSTSFLAQLNKLLETHRNSLTRSSRANKHLTQKPSNKISLMQLARQIGALMGNRLLECIDPHLTAETVWRYCLRFLDVSDAHSKKHIKEVKKKANLERNATSATTTPIHTPQWQWSRDEWEPYKVIVWNLQQTVAQLKRILNAKGITTKNWLYSGQTGVAPHRRLEIFVEKVKVLESHLNELVSDGEIQCSSIACGRSFNTREKDRKRRADGWVKQRLKATIPLNPSKRNNKNKNKKQRRAKPAAQPTDSNPFRILDEFDVCSLKVATFNACGCRDRQFEFGELLLNGSLPPLDIIAIQETHLPLNEKASLPGYYFLGKGRPKTPGTHFTRGGLGFFIKDYLFPHTSILKLTSSDNLECMWITLKQPGKQAIIVGNFYGPQESMSREAVEAIYLNLESNIHEAKNHGKVILVGDFNAKIGRIGDRVGPFGADSVSSNGKKLLQMMTRTDLWCLNGRQVSSRRSHSTHFGTGQESMIDLIMVDHSLVHPDMEAIVSPYNCGSDHQLVWSSIANAITPKEKSNLNPRLRWRLHLLPTRTITKEEIQEEERQDRNSLNQTVGRVFRTALDQEFDSDPPLSGDTVDTHWAKFLSNLNWASMDAIGKKKKSGRNKAWWDRDCTKAAKKSRTAFELFRKSRSQEDWISYKKCRKDMKLLVYAKKVLHRKDLSNVVEQSRTEQPKLFWTLINRLCGPKSSPAPTPIQHRDELVWSPQDQAEAFAEHYRILGNPPDDLDTNLNDHFATVSSSVSVYANSDTNGDFPALISPFTEDEVLDGIGTLKKGKAGGEDDLVNELLIAGDKHIARHLVDLFNKALETETTPRQWKVGTICSIFKNGDRSKCSNYRGITLLPVVGKLYSILWEKRLRAVLEPLLHDEQGGFRTERGCEDQLVILNALIQDSIKRKDPLSIAFIDLQKAYDMVWRDGLWYKLSNFNIPSKVIRVLQEIYGSVINRARVGSCVSHEFNISTGLKQGCPLSPLLFNVYINDLIDDLKEKECIKLKNERTNVKPFNSLLFADDLGLCARSNHTLNKLLGTLDRWCQRWKMKVNVDKSEVMVVIKKVGLNEPTRVRYQNIPLKQTTIFKYLGLQFSSNGKWTQHEAFITKKVQHKMSRLGKLLSNHSLTPSTRMRIWQTIIRPCIEYGMAVWTPTADLEKLQLKAAKLTLGCNNHTASPAVLCDLGLMLLENRAKLYKLRLLHRIKALPRNRLLKQVWNYCRSNPTEKQTDWTQQMLKIGDEFPLVGPPESMYSESAEILGMHNEKALRTKASKCSSLRYCLKFLSPLRPLQLLNSPEKTAIGRVVFKLRSNTAPVMAFLAKYDQEGSARCLCCNTEEEEDLRHFLLTCPCEGLAVAREQLIQSLPDPLSQGDDAISDILGKYINDDGVAQNLYNLWTRRCEALTMAKNQNRVNNLLNYFDRVSITPTNIPTPHIPTTDPPTLTHTHSPHSPHSQNRYMNVAEASQEAMVSAGVNGSSSPTAFGD